MLHQFDALQYLIKQAGYKASVISIKPRNNIDEVPIT